MAVSSGLNGPVEQMGSGKPRPIASAKKKSSILTRIRNMLVGAHYFTIKTAERPKLIIRNQYDANETTWNLLTYYGTAIEYIIWKPLTWTCIGMHYFGFFYMQSLRRSCTTSGDCWVDRFTSSYSIQSSDITIFTTLVVFLFVSYNNMCYQILQKQYFSSQLICGRISSIAMQLRAVVHLPSNRWNVHRYILAAQNVFYWNLRKANAETHSYTPEDKEHPGSWEQIASASLIPHNLLTEEEADYLGKYKGNKCNLLMSWFERSLRKMMMASAPEGEKGSAVLETEHDKSTFERFLIEHILAIKTQFASTLEVQHLKVPFSYYHLTYLLLMISLVLLAYAFVFINDNKGNPVSLVIYPSIVVVLSGLQEQANKMSDPFGEDEDDLNVAGFLIASLEESRNLCFAPELDDVGLDLGVDSANPGIKEEKSFAWGPVGPASSAAAMTPDGGDACVVIEPAAAANGGGAVRMGGGSERLRKDSPDAGSSAVSAVNGEFSPVQGARGAPALQGSGRGNGSSTVLPGEVHSFYSDH